MPKPKDNETRKEFVKRCIPIVIEDRAAEDGDQAVAVCNSMWEEAKKDDMETRTDDLDTTGSTKSAYVKAVGDWELEVLAVPFGGPIQGKDRDREYFSSNTELYLEHFKSPLVTYWHGFNPDGFIQSNVEIIGKTKPETWEKRKDGWWVRLALDKTNELAKRVWDAAKEGIARASTGSIAHLVRKAKDGEILKWAVAEVALLDAVGSRQPINDFAVALPVMKTRYKKAGYEFPDIQPDESEPEVDAKGDKTHRVETEQTDDPATNKKLGANEMENDEVKTLVADGIAEALKAEREAQEAREAAAKAEQEKIEAAKAEAVKEAEKEWAEANRLPSNQDTPHIAKYGETWKYDNLEPADLALMAGILGEAQKARISKNGISDNALKALVLKLSEDKSRVGVMGQQAMKAAGMAFKTDEVMQQDLSSYGDEWVGVAYSQALWEAIRVGTFVVGNLPSIEVPAGHESIILPLESTDPVYYKVAETTDHDGTMGFPVASVTSSQMGTGNVTLPLVKMGARVAWSGELEEDSLIPFVSQLRSQLTKAGAEQLEHAIIDGDTDTTNTTNINDIAGAPADTDLFLMFNGFRKSCLITTTANARDGGTITTSDFLETLKLMGTAGINALDINKVAFICDVNTHWKVSELPEVLTRDVFTQATLENGLLKSIFGYPVYGSANMHYVATSRKTESTGKIDIDTQSDNTKGALLAVRWDQWKLGYRRRMTIETTRYPRSDSSEIVALMRLGLIQRDTEASAISYNLTV